MRNVHAWGDIATIVRLARRADMQDFDRMNDAYVEKMGKRRPARTAIAVSGLPKPGALLTMNLTAVTKE